MFGSFSKLNLISGTSFIAGQISGRIPCINNTGYQDKYTDVYRISDFRYPVNKILNLISSRIPGIIKARYKDKYTTLCRYPVDKILNLISSRKPAIYPAFKVLFGGVALYFADFFFCQTDSVYL